MMAATAGQLDDPCRRTAARSCSSSSAFHRPLFSVGSRTLCQRCMHWMCERPGTCSAMEHTVRRLWSTTEDALLRSAIQKIGPRKWRTIAEHVPGRSHIQCMQRWHKVLEPTLNKGLWKAEEDEQLRAAVRLHGSSSWPAVAAIIPGRNCKQCRERWNNYLDPTLKKGCWEPAEDKALVKGQEMFGSRWSLLAKLLPGRSQIQVRDRCRVLGLKAKQAGKHAMQTKEQATTPTKAKEFAVATPGTMMLPSASS